MHTPITREKVINTIIIVQIKHPAKHLIKREYKILTTNATPNIPNTKNFASLKSEKYFCKSPISPKLAKSKFTPTDGIQTFTNV